MHLEQLMIDIFIPVQDIWVFDLHNDVSGICISVYHI